MKKLSPRFFACGQITVTDLGVAAAQGIKTIINNRPDDELQGQPSSAELAAAAESCGIEYVHIPVVPGLITEENIDDFESACRDSQGPILGFCRTGTRSACLWALNEAKSLDVDAILAATGKAGYDLAALRARLESRSAGA